MNLPEIQRVSVKKGTERELSPRVPSFQVMEALTSMATTTL